jgi:hypothetical protein
LFNLDSARAKLFAQPQHPASALTRRVKGCRSEVTDSGSQIIENRLLIR